MSSKHLNISEKNKAIAENKLELLLFRLNNTALYGINVFKVQEILKCPRIVHIPKSHKSVKGLITVRNTTLAVIDLNLAIGDERGTDIESCFVIIAEYNGKSQAFMVNEVDKIINVKWTDVEKPHKSLNNSFLTSITKLNNDIVQILDVEKVLNNINPANTKVSVDIIEASKFIDCKKYVIVVDDSSVARTQISNCLNDLDVEYKLFENGKEALDFIENLSLTNVVTDDILMVITDIEMPVMDGYNLTSSIKSNEKLKDLHVLLHTSISGSFNNELILKVGANEFVPKFDSNLLAQHIIDKMTS